MQHIIKPIGAVMTGQDNWRRQSGYRHHSRSSGPLMPMDAPAKWWQVWRRI